MINVLLITSTLTWASIKVNQKLMMLNNHKTICVLFSDTGPFSSFRCVLAAFFKIFWASSRVRHTSARDRSVWSFRCCLAGFILHLPMDHLNIVNGCRQIRGRFLRETTTSVTIWTQKPHCGSRSKHAETALKQLPWCLGGIYRFWSALDSWQEGWQDC